MDITTPSVIEGVDTNISLNLISWAVYCSSALLVTLCFILVVASLYSHCKSKKTVSRRTSITPENAFERNSITGDHRYEHPLTSQHRTSNTSQAISVKSLDKPEENRSGTITAIVQINIGDIADGTTTLTRSLPGSIITATATKMGTLPKYENTAVKSKKDYEHHNLRCKDVQQSPYDYPVNLKQGRPACCEISGYMEALDNKESIYEAVDRKS